MTEIKALTQLRERGAVIGPDGNAMAPDVSGWATTQERVVHQRGRIEAVAFAGGGLDELYVFLARAAHDAIHSWNSEQTWLGRIRNRFTIRFSGFAQVSGRGFLHVMRTLGAGVTGAITSGALYLVRADIAANFRDQIIILREQAA